MRKIKKKAKAKPDNEARGRWQGILLLLAIVIGLGTVLVLYTTTRHKERVEGVITDQYGLPGRSGGSSVCRISVAGRGTVYAACGAWRTLPQTVTVELNETYLFGASLNRVVSP
jgi:hypothetical protein